MSKDQAHHAECWRDPKHHGCAVRAVERMRGSLAKISRIIAGVEPGAVHRDPYDRLRVVQEIALPFGLESRRNEVDVRRPCNECGQPRACPECGGGRSRPCECPTPEPAR